MKKIFYKIYFITLVFLAILSVFPSKKVEAQNNQCQVTSAEFRTSRALGPNFYQENSRPFVYIDITTQNCVGQNIQVSITESDVGPDDDVNGNLGGGQWCSNNNNSCMDNRMIFLPQGSQDNITLALKAGEDECDGESNPDCEYYITTWDGPNDQLPIPGDITTIGDEWHSGLQLDYNCVGGCTDNWQYLGIISYHSIYPGDQDNADNESQTPNNDNTDNESQAPNTNGPSGPLVIDLNLQNPLAGTIDNIPTLFQKIVDIIIKIAVPLVAIAILYSGFLFVTARGDESQLKTARGAFTFAVIGGLVLMLSWLVAQGIQEALTSLNS